jgi:hypothetical protein
MQNFALPLAILSQFLIRHDKVLICLTESSPRHPGHTFFSRVYAKHNRQFIPHGAISLVGMAFVFSGLLNVMYSSESSTLIQRTRRPLSGAITTKHDSSKKVSYRLFVAT